MTVPNLKQQEVETGVLVIGAGQAGLAAGFHLKKAGVPHVILEASPRLGDSWRNRYESLTLFTPRAFSQLPDFNMPGEPQGYPSRDEFADYLEAFARVQGLSVQLNARVARLEHDGRFAATLEGGSRIAADQVIVATGAFQQSVTPSLAKGFGRDVVQLTASSYRNPRQLPKGTVLVVGDGASGRDIAAEIASTHTTLLATGKPRKLLPEQLLGRSIWWWLGKMGLLKKPADSMIGRTMRAGDPFPDRDRSVAALKRRGIILKPRLVEADGALVTFQDKGVAEVAAVIWATGYRDEIGWIDLPGAVTPQGAFAHKAGVSPVPGLFFVGRPWQRNRASSLVLGAGADAGQIVGAITCFRRQAVASFARPAAQGVYS